jgi:hypothetical protein
MTTRIRVIPAPPANDAYAPNGRHGVPMPQDLAEHQPVLPYDDGGDFDPQLDHVHRAAAALVHDPVREVALAIGALSYEEKREVAVSLRTSVTRLNAWASVVIEARS